MCNHANSAALSYLLVSVISLPRILSSPLIYCVYVCVMVFVTYVGLFMA